MTQMNEPAALGQLTASQSPILIFENMNKEETEKAEERLRQQEEEQRRIQEEPPAKSQPQSN
jgi:hypothetical protein